jgi:hypothetical protein
VIEAAHAADPQVWAESGGIAGLVILALFASLWYFVRAQEKMQEAHLSAQEKMYQLHRTELQSVLEMHADERHKWGLITDERQRETNEIVRSMVAAIHELNNSHGECTWKEKNAHKSKFGL